jgi:hypothetical protein
VPKLVGFLLFLVFAEDYGAAYDGHLITPLAWVFDVFLQATPIKIRGFDLAMLAILSIGLVRRDRRGFVAPMKHMLLLMLATTVLWLVYGLTHGGDFRFASWQSYLIVSSVLVAFTVGTTFKTFSDFEGLAKWLLAAAFYRATFCWISYFTWARAFVGASGAFLTTHDDTIGWVVGILILTIQALNRRSALITFRNLVAILFFLGAIQFNSRRLAWVSLAMAFATAYVLFPAGPLKRRLNKALLAVAPLVLIYVAVGWGRGERIFLPLRSLSSVSTNEDASTLARNAENLGLIATANYASSLFGTGWGRPYVFLTMKYDISGAFELWRYIPHNSILGLLAFTGTLGFAGFWMAMPTAAFLLARVARLANDPRARSIGIIAASQMIVCANQLYGDMGIFFVQPMYVLAVSYGIALRLPQLAGVWRSSKANAKQATAH